MNTITRHAHIHLEYVESTYNPEDPNSTTRAREQLST